MPWEILRLHGMWLTGKHPLRLFNLLALLHVLASVMCPGGLLKGTKQRLCIHAPALFAFSCNTTSHAQLAHERYEMYNQQLARFVAL
jgi:hypothetical protein